MRESAVVAVIVALPLGQPEPFTLRTLAEKPTPAAAGCVGAAVLDIAGATLVLAGALVLVLETEGVGLTVVPGPDERPPCGVVAAGVGSCLDCSVTSPEQPQTHAALSSGSNAGREACSHDWFGLFIGFLLRQVRR